MVNAIFQKNKLDNARNLFFNCGSLRIHYIYYQDRSTSHGCRVGGNDVIMYIDETLLWCGASIVRKIYF
jgi:hypothetical protein